jgi:membrane protein YqaA with SNARE-associated domain
MPLPKADVIVMVPVGMAHVGCVVTLAAGVAGADGAAFTTSPVSAVEVPQLLVAVSE